MTALDTSVSIPALVSWHEAHDQTRLRAAGAHIPAHGLAETYSVLTRLPSPHRLDAAIAAPLVRGWFPSDRILATPAALQRRLVELLAASGLEGGATYDGLVGLTARHHGHVLLTRDRRAATTYEALDVKFELLTA
ncbi:MAG: type II toxin-antitoxin system VapC family toxin [Actinomycetota bacterium]|nr:type II toxin-antitoxin system VapC family toxin [Actinomycetota bacterium]